MSSARTASTADPAGDAVARLIGAAAMAVFVIVVLPLVIPLAVRRVAGDTVATRARFWVVWKCSWLRNPT